MNKKMMIVGCIMLFLWVALLGVEVIGAEKEVVTFWHPYGPPYDALMNKACAAVEEKHPDIKVVPKIVPWDGFIQKLAVAVAAGNPPDTAHIYGMTTTLSLAQMGLLEPLDPFTAKDPTWNPDDLYPTFLDSFTYKGHLMGFNISSQPPTLAWNKSTFKEVGLDPEKGPESLEEIVKIQEKLYKVGPKGKIERYGFIPHLLWGGFLAWASFWGGKFYDPATGKITASDPANIRALQWQMDFYKKYGGLERVSVWQKGFTGGANNPFIRGVLGMQIFNHYQYYELKTYAPDLEYGFCKVPPMGPPVSGRKKGGVTASDAWIMLRGCKHKQAAYAFLREFCHGDGYLKAFLPFGGYPSCLKSMNEYVYKEKLFPDWVKPELFKLEMEVSENLVAFPQIPVYARLTAELDNQAELANRGKKSAKEALEYVDQVIQKELERALRRER